MTDFELSRPSSSQWRQPPLIALLMANVIPLVGVLGLGWTVFEVMLLFWMENIVIGLFNLARLLTTHFPLVLKVFFSGFFCVHYGAFTAAHGVFVIALFGGGFNHPSPSAADVWSLITEPHMLIAIGALVISHGISFGWYFLWRGEYKTIGLDGLSALMIRPYGRVVVLHVTIIIGGFLLMAFETPTAGLVLLIVLKIMLDARSHMREHQSTAAQEATASPHPTRGTLNAEDQGDGERVPR